MNTLENKFSYGHKLNKIQVELSTVCNALCLGCVRANDNFTAQRSNIPKNKFLDIKHLTDILETEYGQNIKKIEFCGTIDDPLTHPNFLDLLDILYDMNPEYVVQVHTNGGLRSTDYHKKLGEKIAQFREPSRIRYSIDGSDDTHSFYRQNTNFKKTIENLRAATSTEAYIVWQFLIFPWNKHQIEDVKQMAKETGCDEVWIRPDRSVCTTLGEAYFKIIKNIKGFGFVKRQDNFSLSWPRKDDDSIKCRFKNKYETTVFLDWQGLIWPCCFHANVAYASKIDVENYFKYVFKDYNPNFNSILDKSFDDVMNHSFYKKDLMESWFDKDDKRGWRCTQKCRSNRIRESDKKNDHANGFGIERKIL